jgi:hypothetical protein
MEREYKVVCNLFECYEAFEKKQLERLKEDWILDLIHIISNSNNSFTSMFEKIYKGYTHIDIYWNEMEVYFDDWKMKAEFYNLDSHIFWMRKKIEKYIKDRTIEIEVRWYFQWEYDKYIVLVKNIEDIDKVRGALSFIKNLFTVIEIRMWIIYKDIIVNKWIEFTTKWNLQDEKSMFCENIKNESKTIDLLFDELLLNNKWLIWLLTKPNWVTYKY